MPCGLGLPRHRKGDEMGAAEARVVRIEKPGGKGAASSGCEVGEQMADRGPMESKSWFSLRAKRGSGYHGSLVSVFVLIGGVEKFNPGLVSMLAHSIEGEKVVLIDFAHWFRVLSGLGIYRTVPQSFRRGWGRGKATFIISFIPSACLPASRKKEQVACSQMRPE
ncbi:hypothetical protein AXG93_685s1070 [Marchantia polymorpha subsp. ruderalis]|uniref:Uncharacterized protein n=1 Tax=Marchantia polymorpha subsp. ruderalis TaxID=1480154 RepID=A0A176WFI1_MARPO|nr:hypothetical protein AXG93_685s1070 [Marchantia polymorpha subsp. ruderalis]